MTKENIRDFYQQLKENMSKEELAGLELYKFMVYKIMQKYIVKNEGKFIKGDTYYDIETAINENAFVSHFYKGEKKALSDMLCKIKKQIKKGYIPILEPKSHPKGYVREKEILGNYKCRRNNKCRCDNCFFNEIKSLIEMREKYEDHSRRLQRKYGKMEEVVKAAWDWISDELINQLGLEIINHQLSPEIINHQLNPEDIKLLRKEIINNLISPEDIKLLREKKIKLLREERKFFKSHQPLNEEKINEKSQEKDITEEEYKRRFGYYPDLGRK